MSDYYEILGVSRQASAEEIKKAYRKKARTLHPDIAGPGHEEEFKMLSVAYETLSDPDKRQMYDLGGEDALRGGGGFGGGFEGAPGAMFEEFMSNFFGGQSNRGGPVSRTRRGQDTLVSLTVDLAAATFGSTETVTVDTYVTCEACSGSCCQDGTEPVTCSNCNGSGHVQQVRRSFLGNMVTSGPCPQCQGYGTVIVTPCQQCDGHGRTATRREVEVRVPAGVSTGIRIRMNGGGDAGPAGGPNGDLYVEINVAPHEFLERRQDDLYTQLKVPMTAAALGATYPLETLDGEKTITLKPGIQSGDEVVLDGLGVGHLRSNGRGDLHVTIVVETPTKLDEQQRELIRQLAELRGEDGNSPVKGESVMDKLKEKFSGR